MYTHLTSVMGKSNRGEEPQGKRGKKTEWRRIGTSITNSEQGDQREKRSNEASVNLFPKCGKDGRRR